MGGLRGTSKMLNITKRTTKEVSPMELLVDRWGDGYSRGRKDQKEEDEAQLSLQLEDAYEDGYDKGFEEGQASARKEVTK